MEHWIYPNPNLAQEKEPPAHAESQSNHQSNYRIAAFLLATASITNAAPAVAHLATDVDPELDTASQVNAQPDAIAGTTDDPTVSVEADAASPIEWSANESINLAQSQTLYTSTLSRGSQGESVSALQRQLKAWGYAVTVDGDFGPQTHGAVVQFQSDQGLAQDGIVGQNTAALLASSQSYAPTTQTYPTYAHQVEHSSQDGQHYAPEAINLVPAQVAQPVVEQSQPLAQEVKTINVQRSPKPDYPVAAAPVTTAQIPQLEPFNLVYLAYQGYFRDQGIPSLGEFAEQAFRRRITPEDLIQAAVAQNRLSADVLEDDGYINEVRSAIRGIFQDFAAGNE